MVENSMPELEELFDGQKTNLDKTVRCFKVLAHPDRMKIIWNLRFGERAVNELEKRTGLKQTTISQHLSLLKDRDLVESRRDGSHVFYRLSSHDVIEVFSLIQHLYRQKDVPMKSA